MKASEALMNAAAELREAAKELASSHDVGSADPLTIMAGATDKASFWRGVVAGAFCNANGMETTAEEIEYEGE